ncbi:hypothetical protein JCGZ_05653 [Jatropha curcas]|uniref:RING-type E3 ubiquitin transferase n=1 Tax=Jatropha curcas TaxID=180498 RepID=A0A067L6V3_JATCU|nr:hypothetical protein JCGZ_05653 [Jatropha curcas]
MLPLTSSPPPVSEFHPEDFPSQQWNPYVIGPLIAMCIVVVIFSYYKIIKRLCCALNTLTFSRNHVQTRHLSVEDPSLQYQSHGLESIVMDSLPISQFKKEKEQEETRQSNSECAVCLGEFEEGEWLKHLPNCAHVFHVACIDTWFQTHSSCPLCRSLVYENSISINTLIESLQREDFFHQRAEYYQILRSQIFRNSATRP